MEKHRKLTEAERGRDRDSWTETKGWTDTETGPHNHGLLELEEPW